MLILFRAFSGGAMLVCLWLCESLSPIHPVLVCEAWLALQLSQALRELGILISAIRPPTVAEGSARLRITLSAAHEEAQVEQLLAALDAAGMAA